MSKSAPNLVSSAPLLLIELGGTKINLSVYEDTAGMGPVIRLPTRGGHETLMAVVAEAKTILPNPGSIGVASFGPVCLDHNDPRYGQILKTPKPNWTGIDLLGPLKEAFLGVPIGLDTDVNAAALAEGQWGASQGLKDHVYVTIGTGVGFGIIVKGSPIHGALHPEAGHIKIAKRIDDGFAGNCPFHNDCLEGLISGPSILARTHMSAETIPANDPLWELIGDYLAQGLMNIALTTASKRIVLGGGVGLNPALLAPTWAHFHAHMGGYLEHLSDLEDIKSFITPAQLGDKAGLMGALILARQALRNAL